MEYNVHEYYRNQGEVKGAKEGFWLGISIGIFLAGSILMGLVWFDWIKIVWA